MSFEVLLTEGAARDLEDIFDGIARRDDPGNATYVLDRIEAVFTGLSEFPERGAHPRELLELGIRKYREVFFKPFRIIYRVSDAKVFVLLVADGRRDMRALLQRRLLEF